MLMHAEYLGVIGKLDFLLRSPSFVPNSTKKDVIWHGHVETVMSSSVDLVLKLAVSPTFGRCLRLMSLIQQQ